MWVSITATSGGSVQPYRVAQVSGVGQLYESTSTEVEPECKADRALLETYKQEGEAPYVTGIEKVKPPDKDPSRIQWTTQYRSLLSPAGAIAPQVERLSFVD